MSKWSAVYKEEKKKELNPVWRGIGCVTVVVIFSLSFLLSSWLITEVTTRPASELPLPAQLKFVPGATRQMQAQFRAQFPKGFGISTGDYVAPFGLSVVVSLFSYGVVSAIYAMFRGDINDPRDVRNWAPSSRKKRSVRKCR